MLPIPWQRETYASIPPGEDVRQFGLNRTGAAGN